MTDVSSQRTLWTSATDWANRRAQEDVLVNLPDPADAATTHAITWERFVSEVWELRCRLAAIGVSDQRTVVLALPNSPLTVALWLAIPTNGAIVQAVDPDSGVLTFERAVRSTEPVAVIAAESNAGSIAEAIARTGVDTRLIVPTDLSLSGGYQLIAGLAATGANPPQATADMIAGLLPTSGTSGAPKLVQLTHRNYITAAERLARNSGYLATDRHYLCSPFFHTNAQLYLCAPPFVTGGSIAITARFSASGYFDIAKRTGATVSSMVAPPMRMALHKAMERDTAVEHGRLRLIQYGMSLSRADWQAWDRLIPDIAMRQIYGQTESVTGVLGGSPWELDDRITIGRPFVGVERVRLVGEDGTDVPDGQPGELWVKGTRGTTLMLGYHEAKEATDEAIVDGCWLRTGDMMVRHPNGRLEFRGRRLHIIRRGGENLSTYALELDLQSCPLLSDVAVTAKADSTLDAIVVAHVIPRAGYSAESFRTWCLDNLGKRGVPDEVRVHDSFPRTGSGRVIGRDLQ